MNLIFKTKYKIFTILAISAIGIASATFAMAATPVYYSVGQDGTTDNKTGTPTVTISSGVATFSTAQTGNIGIGDRITYNTSDIAYISGKTSTTVWSVVTATGTAPTDITDSTVVSIKREYTSLSAAEAGASDSNHLNTSDLVTGNYQLNFPCYYDTGADTTAVTIDGWTTGADNYIKAYTPNDTVAEANQSQRHSGVAETGYYIKRTAWGDKFTIRDDYVRIDGLGISGETSAGTNSDCIKTSGLNGSDNTEIMISNSIFWNGNLTGNDGLYLPSSAKYYIWNNIIYDMDSYGITIGYYNQKSIGYVYNNTIYNTEYGVYQGDLANDSVLVFKNNLFYNNVTEDFHFYSGDESAGVYTTANNISSDATSPDGASYQNKTVSFIDSTNDNFHLSASDTAAFNAGVNLSADANLSFSTDIDGDQRDEYWSIGADEGPEHWQQTPGTHPNDEGASIDLNNGLVGYWSFDGDDISGTTAYDRSGNGNNGTLTNGPTPTIGKKGQGLSFDGGDDYVDVGDTYLDSYNEGTVSAWVKFSSLSDTNNFFGIESTHSHKFMKFGIYGSGRLNMRLSNDWSSDINAEIRGDSVMNEGSWHHVVVSSTGSDYEMYVDGISQSLTYRDGYNFSLFDSSNKGIWFNDLESLPGSYYIGRLDCSALDGYFNGQIDEVRIYNRALTPDEVGDLYRMGEFKYQR